MPCHDYGSQRFFVVVETDQAPNSAFFFARTFNVSSSVSFSDFLSFTHLLSLTSQIVKIAVHFIASNSVLFKQIKRPANV